MFRDRVAAVILAAVLAGCVLFWDRFGWDRTTIAGTAWFGLSTYGLVVGIQTLLAMAFAGSSIAREARPQESRLAADDPAHERRDRAGHDGDGSGEIRKLCDGRAAGCRLGRDRSVLRGGGGSLFLQIGERKQTNNMILLIVLCVLPMSGLAILLTESRTAPVCRNDARFCRSKRSEICTIYVFWLDNDKFGRQDPVWSPGCCVEVGLREGSSMRLIPRYTRFIVLALLAVPPFSSALEPKQPPELKKVSQGPRGELAVPVSRGTSDAFHRWRVTS